jgi:hypothetical protein
MGTAPAGVRGSGYSFGLPTLCDTKHVCVNPFCCQPVLQHPSNDL